MSRVYETAIKIGATISRAFKSDTYNAAAAVTKLADATKKLQAAEKSAAAYKKLESEVARAKSRYDVATSSLRKLEDAERAAGGATAESTRWRKAGTREVASAARQLDRATKAAQKNSEALQKLGVDTSKLASEQQRLARTLAATERQEKALASYEKSRERLFGARSKTPLAQKAGEQIRGVASDMMFLGTAAAGAVGGVAALVVKTIKAGDEIGDTADKLGIASTALQELRYGARQSGSEVGSLDKAIAKMAINIGKAKLSKGKGSAGGLLNIPGAQSLDVAAAAAGATVDPFKQIGLKAKDLARLKPDEQLKKIADGMARLKTQADRAAVAQLIFGKGATDILPFLAEGSAGIERLSRDAHKYGGVLSEEAIRNADLADKAMRDAEMAVGGLVATLTADLLPVATEVFKSFSKWVASNRGEIKEWAGNAARWITGTGIPAFKRITGEVVTFGGKVLWLVNGAAKLTGGFGNLAMVVAGLRIAPLAVTFAKIGIEATKAAIAIFKYVAAKRAAGALGADAGGGVGGGGGSVTAGPASGWILKGLGLSVGEFALLAAPVAISAAALIYAQSQKDKAVDALVTGTDEYNKKFQDDAEFRKDERDKFYTKVKGITRRHGGMVTGDEAAAAAGPAMPRTGAAAAAGSTFAPVINIEDARTRDDVANGLDAAKRKALEEWDRREAHRKRVSYGG